MKLTAYATVGAYSLVLALYGLALPSAIAKLLGFLPIVLVGLFWFLDTWVWRVPPLPALLKSPTLSGTWRGTLTSYRRDREDRPTSSTHPVYIVIRQTLLSVSITLISEQSKSRSSAAQLVNLQEADYRLYYQYQNEPQMKHRRAGSQPHSGGSTIDIGGHYPVSLRGEYWTGRDTSGSFSVTKIARKRVNAFDEGDSLYALSSIK